MCPRKNKLCLIVDSYVYVDLLKRLARSRSTVEHATGKVCSYKQRSLGYQTIYKLNLFKDKTLHKWIYLYNVIFEKARNKHET